MFDLDYTPKWHEKIMWKIEKILDFRAHYLWFKYGVENCIKFFPLVWKDRDWDYYFLLKLIQFKLKNMANLHEKYGHCVNKDRYIKQMKTAANLIERITSDDGYYVEDCLVFNKKGNYFLTRINGKMRSTLMLQQDIDLLFKIMNKHMLDWWD